jgi:pimeloyl-ACP methyl ester carboxylesterase
MMIRSVMRLAEGLGFAGVPTVVVGHSMAALSLLCLTDDELGPRVSRVALNPVMPWLDPVVRRRFAQGARALRAVGWLRPVRVWGTRRDARRSAILADAPGAVRELAIAESLAMPWGVAWRLLDGLCASRPAPGRHHRLMIMACTDDPLVRLDVVERAAEELGVGATNLRLFATGGHLPHIENEAHPEWTARNVAELVHLVNTMLLSAREGTPASTRIESTGDGLDNC